MQIPSIQHLFNVLAAFTFVMAFPIALMLLFSVLFLIEDVHFLSNEFMLGFFVC